MHDEPLRDFSAYVGNRAAARRARRAAQRAVADAFARPPHDLSAADVAAVDAPAVAWLFDLFFVAHVAKEWIDGDERLPTATELSIVRELARAWPHPHDAEGLRRRIGVTRQATRRATVRMAQAGLVVVGPDNQDRRTNVMWLTQRGVDELRKGMKVADWLARQLEAGIEPDRFTRLRAHAKELRWR